MKLEIFKPNEFGNQNEQIKFLNTPIALRIVSDMNISLKSYFNQFIIFKR